VSQQQQGQQAQQQEKEEENYNTKYLKWFSSWHQVYIKNKNMLLKSVSPCLFE
jgi:hypothetical protein